MANQDAFNAAAFAYTGNHAILGAVAQAMGIEKTLALNAQVYGQLGVGYGQQLKAQADIEGDADLQTAFGVMKKVMTDLGIDFEVIEHDDSHIAFKVGGCPIYAGAAIAGWENQTIAVNCGGAAIGFLDAAAKQLNPNLAWRMRSFRSSVEDGCVEELVLEA